MKLNKYWFEKKSKGAGIVPSTWEGYVAILLLMILILISVQTNGFFVNSYSSNKVLRLIFDAFIITTVFTLVLKHKTKEGLFK
jgi:hypothetical protein